VKTARALENSNYNFRISILL